MAARRAELLAAAHQVVIDRGLANTRVADVAAATNVSGGLIHYHFATKDVLLVEMLRSVAGDRHREGARRSRRPRARPSTAGPADPASLHAGPWRRPAVAALDRRLGGRRP